MINNNERILKICIENGISFDQYFFLYFVVRKDFIKPYVESLSKQYLDKVKKIPYEDVNDLIERGFVDDMNSDSRSLPELYMVNDKVFKIFVSIDMAEEFWDSYPAMLPLGGGTSFVARSGQDRDELLDVYRERINYDAVKHKFVMKMVQEYQVLVKNGKINGHKISDFIKQELWDTVFDIIETTKQEDFGQDI